MAQTFRRSIAKITFTLFLMTFLLAVTAQRAAAFDGAENKNKEATPSAGAAETNAAPSAVAPGIVSAAFSEALKPQPDVKIKGTLAQVGTSKMVVTRTPANMPLPPRAPAVSTAPMTPGEKFNLFVKRSFLSPGAYAMSVVTGVYGEWIDDDHHHHSKPGDFAADSMTRAARSFAFRATANFFEKFAYASLFKQDPRYHRSNNRKAGAKISYAISRVFITQGDRCGCDQFNISFIAGGLTAAGISNLWERDERMTVAKTFSRWGTHVAFTALNNILREFIGGQ